MLSYLVHSLEARKLKQRIDQNPDAIRQIFREFDTRNRHIPDTLLDSLLGLAPFAEDKFVDYRSLESQYGREQFVYEGTPYDYVRKFLRTLKPGASDTIYDLGSGFGRVVFYGALTTRARFVGIEVVPERVAVCQRIVSRFAITNAQFICSNVLEQKYDDGAAFFLFNPFTDATTLRVLEELKRIALQKRIMISAWGGGGTRLLTSQSWLREIPFEEDYISIGPLGLKIYASRAN